MISRSDTPLVTRRPLAPPLAVPSALRSGVVTPSLQRPDPSPHAASAPVESLALTPLSELYRCMKAAWEQ